MIHFSLPFELFRWPTIHYAAIGLLAVSNGVLFAASANAQDTDYGACADELLAAGIESETAAIACSLAFEPTEVSSCVSDVLFVAEVDPTVALSACSRDRRPDEVATCVVDIHQTLLVDDSFTVLNYCHRSILPERYADCVIGITNEAGFTTDESLGYCIAAGYRPVDVAPTFILTE